jgi:hypothetical protein
VLALHDPLLVLVKLLNRLHARYFLFGQIQKILEVRRHVHVSKSQVAVSLALARECRVALDAEERRVALLQAMAHHTPKRILQRQKMNIDKFFKKKKTHNNNNNNNNNSA